MKKIYRLLNWLFRKNDCCCKNRKQGKDLIFISHIKRKGEGTSPVTSQDGFYSEWFTVNCLSITEGTYIASGFNSYVVKFKK